MAWQRGWIFEGPSYSGAGWIDLVNKRGWYYEETQDWEKPPDHDGWSVAQRGEPVKLVPPTTLLNLLHRRTRAW